MIVRDAAPLAPRTTFGIGGPARTLAIANTADDIKTAVALARDRGLPIRVLGGGSNVLVPDAGVEAFVVVPAMNDIAYIEEGDETLLVADAGARWDAVVDAAALRELWGIENLAGIPGTAGGAAVQNIGAYGAELADTFAWADTLNADTLLSERVEASRAEFSYRMSLWKRERHRIITRVALRLRRNGTPNLGYADLARAAAAGVRLDGPQGIADAVRAIRRAKFPGPQEEGTAGSFWKNPVILSAHADALKERYPNLPTYPQPDGTTKVSLAWLLDHALSLKGFSCGQARLYEKQPLVVVVQKGARARDVEELAQEVAARVFAATGIAIEREVESFDARA